jgi:hypothetical protein
MLRGKLDFVQPDGPVPVTCRRFRDRDADTLQHMPAEALLLAIATVAVVVAGFTGVTSTLVPPGGAWQPAMRIRQRAIVSTSFNVMFEALAPSIAFAWLGNVHDALVVTSAVVAAYATGIVTWRGRQFIRAGSYRTRSTLVLYALGPIATLLFWANAIVFASVAVYALALCVQLSVAVMSFYSLVSAAQS